MFGSQTRRSACADRGLDGGGGDHRPRRCGNGRGRRLGACRARAAECRRRARLQRLQPHPALGEVDAGLRRPGNRARAVRGSRPLHRARRAVAAVHLVEAGLRQRHHLDGAPARRAEGAADDREPGQRRHAHVRALGRAVVLDEPVRSQVRPAGAVHAPLGCERAARELPGGGNAFMELQFYPPGFAPFDDSISCDNTHWCSALTIDSVECDRRGDVQRQLHRARELRVHPARRRPRGAAQPAGVRPADVHAQRADAA